MNNLIMEIKTINYELKEIKKRLIKIKEKIPQLYIANRLLDSPIIHLTKIDSDMETLIDFEGRRQ